MRLDKVALGLALALGLLGCAKAPSSGPGSAGAGPDADPPWPNLVSCLGANTEDPQFKEFAAKYQMMDSTRGGLSGMWSPPGRGAALVCKDEVVIRVVVISQRPRGSPLKAYRGALPYGLTTQDTFEGVLKKFGEPSCRQGRSVLLYAQRKQGFMFLNGTLCEMTQEK